MLVKLRLFKVDNRLVITIISQASATFFTRSKEQINLKYENPSKIVSRIILAERQNIFNTSKRQRKNPQFGQFVRKFGSEK